MKKRARVFRTAIENGHWVLAAHVLVLATLQAKANGKRPTVNRGRRRKSDGPKGLNSSEKGGCPQG